MLTGIPPPLKPGCGMGRPFGGDWFSQELQKREQADTDAQWLWSGGLKPGGLRWKNGIVLSNPPVQAAGMKALSLSAALLLFCSGNSFVHAQEAAAIEESFTELLRVVEDKDGVAKCQGRTVTGGEGDGQGDRVRVAGMGMQVAALPWPGNRRDGFQFLRLGQSHNCHLRSWRIYDAKQQSLREAMNPLEDDHLACGRAFSQRVICQAKR